MKNNVVADTSFFICHACNLRRTDFLLNYLDLYQFYVGPIILMKELPNMGKDDETIRKKLIYKESNYAELFKMLSARDSKHIEEDGEYEAIGLAVELSLTNNLKYLIIDDKGPKNFAKNTITKKFLELNGKIVGTVGFICNCYRIDSLIEKEKCLENLKAIHTAYLEYEQNGKTQRPCSMDDKFINNTLLPLITDLEKFNE